MIARRFFSTNKVATTKTAAENPMIRMEEGSPSRYITIKKEKYTSANPVSFWAILNNAGNKAIPAAISCALVLLKSVSTLDKYFAKANATVILQNSAG